MNVTRRYWATAGLGGLLLVLAVVFSRPLLFGGAVAIGSWLLARQFVFVGALSRAYAAIDIEQSLTQERVVVDNDTAVVLSAALPASTTLDVSIEARPPMTAADSTREDRTITIAHGQQEAATSFTVRWSVAGSFDFESPRVSVTDTAGLFSEEFVAGRAPSIVVEPRGPRNIHVGEGGEQLAAFGEEQEERTGERGLDPGELREYRPDDSVRRIDWKATARLDQPHVREYETETDRVLTLFVDHRSPMAEGPAGETKLDYARQVALGFLSSVRNAGDPIGYTAIGTDGITSRRPPATDQYAIIERRLHDLEPVGPDTDTRGSATVQSPVVARRAVSQLQSENAFDTTLQPYFSASTTYVERIEADPLFEAVRTALRQQRRSSVWTVLFTDDTNRTEVREAVKFARRHGEQVVVFLTPTTLFRPGDVADLEAAYERYVDFEEFRRGLAGLNGVTALEVGPGDRLDAVLAAGRGRRQRPRATQSTTPP